MYLLIQKQNWLLVYGLSLFMLFLAEMVFLWTPVSFGWLSVLLGVAYLAIQLRPIRVPVSRFKTLSLSFLDVSLVLMAGICRSPAKSVKEPNLQSVCHCQPSGANL